MLLAGIKMAQIQKKGTDYESYHKHLCPADDNDHPAVVLHSCGNGRKPYCKSRVLHLAEHL